MTPPTATIQQAMQIALHHHRAGRLAEAEAIYRQALQQQPDLAEAHNGLGLVLKDQKRFDESVAAYRCAIRLLPGSAELQINMGNALAEAGRVEESLAAYRKAVELRPDWADAHAHLANLLARAGRPNEAVAAYRRAIDLRPNYLEAYNYLGIALSDSGQIDEAITVFRQAIAFKPESVEAHNNLGVVLKSGGRLDEAIAAYRQVIALQPNIPEAHNNLGNALKEGGQLDEAVAAYRQAIALNPDFPDAQSNLLYTLHFHPGCDAGAILEAHRRWAARHAQPPAGHILPHDNSPDPDRRLRIGYVSPNFTGHVVGRFLHPVLIHHDHAAFEYFCYSDVRSPTAVTRQMQEVADHWQPIAGIPDAAVEQMIRGDRIDILVDLTLHMAGNRMPLFARKPAPVQVTHLGYPSTTGLSTMDYRLSDPYLDPPGGDESCYTEKTVRLPHCFLCYSPPEPSPPVAEPPALSTGRITFGCLNSFAKVNPAVLDLWARLLGRVDGSRLILRCPEGEACRRVKERMGQAGIDPNRIEFSGGYGPQEQYLHMYDRQDIGLDPFPYPGHTTTLDSLWMGVPVVTLSGGTAVGRGGVSLLSNVGLPELIADGQEQYVEIAVSLANDLPRLVELRRTMRDQMRSSPLTDVVGHTRAIESACRRMWQAWRRG